MDQTTKRLLIAAGALGLLLVGGMGTWAVMGRRPASVPVIEADTRPLRLKPDNPGGMQIAGSDEVVMGGSGRAGTDTMAPAAEVPAPQALRAQMKQPAADAASVAPPVVAPVGAAAPAAPAVPVPTGAGTPVSPLPDTPTRGAARMAAPPAASHATAGSATPAHAAAGIMQVQLAAMDSEAAAQAEWQRLAKRMPELLSTRTPVVLRAERDGKTIWRVRTGGFADVADATGFCGRVRAKGGACSIASF